jgi:hypothetical protein
MTDRIIVATFDNANAAYDAASAIKGLKTAGIADFKLKAGVMVSKDDRGNVSVLENKDRPLLGTAWDRCRRAHRTDWRRPWLSPGGHLGRDRRFDWRRGNGRV